MSADFNSGCSGTAENDDDNISHGDRIDHSEAEYGEHDAIHADNDHDEAYVDNAENANGAENAVDYQKQERYGGINSDAYFEYSSTTAPQQSSSRMPISTPLEELRTTVKRRLADTSGSSQRPRLVSPPGIASARILRPPPGFTSPQAPSHPTEPALLPGLRPPTKIRFPPQPLPMPQFPTGRQAPRNVFRHWNPSLELGSAGLVSQDQSPSSIHQPLLDRRPQYPSLTRDQRPQVLPTGSNRRPGAPFPVQVDIEQQYDRINNWVEETRRAHAQSLLSSSQNIHEYRNNRKTSPSQPSPSIFLHNSSTQSLSEPCSKLPSSGPWTTNYSMRLGTIPSPAACALAPGYQKYMADIPFTGNTTKSTHIHGHFFLKDKNNVVTCKVRMESGEDCGVAYSSSGSTNTRMAHVKRHHKLLFLGLMEFRTHQAAVQGLELEEIAVIDAVNRDSRKQKNPSTGKEALENGTCTPTAAEVEKFEAVLVRMIAVDEIPLTFLQSKTFKMLLDLPKRQYSIPRPAKVHMMVAQRAVKAKMQVRDNINTEVVRGALTVDGWASRAGDKYLGITYHFLTPSFKLRDITIGTIQVDGWQTAENLLESLKNVVLDWHLDKMLLCGTTGQGANIKKALKLNELEASTNTTWGPCSVHMIHLCVNTALKESPGATQVLSKCQSLSSFIKNNSSLESSIYAKQRQSGKEHKALVVPVVTRWNSRYDMASRLEHVYGSVKETLMDMTRVGASQNERENAKTLEPLMLDVQEIEVLKEILTILEPAKVLITWLERESGPTISQIYPKVISMIQQPSTATTEEAMQFQSTYISELNTKWSLDGISNVALLATYLNPASAIHRMFEHQGNDTGDTLRKKAMQLAVDGIMDLTESGDLPQEVHFGPQENVDFWRRRAAFHVQEYNHLVYDHDHSQYVDRPQEFWAKKEGQETYRSLSMLARSCLCAQATSVELGRLFSTASNFVAPKGTRLSPEVVRDLLFLKSFEKYIEAE